jgi:hypothetical protein
MMLTEGEAHLVLGPGHERLSVFLASMQYVDLLYDTDENGAIWFAAWFDSTVLSAGSLSVWITAPLRGTRTALKNTLSALAFAFTKWPVVLVVTSMPEKEKLHRHLGFTPLGHVPHMYFGEPARISYMTAEHFPAVCEHFKTHLDGEVTAPITEMPPATVNGTGEVHTDG